MRNGLIIAATNILTVLTFVGTPHAAELIISSNQGATPGVREVAAAFSRQSGHKVTVVQEAGAALEKRLNDGPLDLVTSNPGPIDELVKISACMKRDFQKLNPSLLFDLQKYHAKAWSVWLGHKHLHIKDSIVRNLKQGIEEGFFRPDINVEVLAITRVETIQFTFDERIFPVDQYSLPEVNGQIFEHFVYGLLTEKGRKVYEKYKLQSNNPELISQSL